MIAENEVAISAELFEKCLVVGFQTKSLVRVQAGPAPGSKLVGVRWEAEGDMRRVVLVYDQPVQEPWIQQLLEAAP